jgi:hypothetical protein
MPVIISIISSMNKLFGLVAFAHHKQKLALWEGI